MNYAPTKNIYRGFNKILHRVNSKVCCYKHPNPKDPEKITEFKFRASVSSIGTHKNDIMKKYFDRKRENYVRKVNTLMNYFSSHQVFLRTTNSPLTSYGLFHSLPIPIYVLVSQYHIYHFVCCCCCQLITVNFTPILKISFISSQVAFLIKTSWWLESTATSSPLYFYSIYLRMFVSDPSVYKLNQLWTQCNYFCLKYSCSMKIKQCALLANLPDSLLVIIWPLRASLSPLLVYLSAINLNGQRYQTITEQ